MVMDIDFHTKYLDGVGDTLKTFPMLDLSPSAGSEAALINRNWDAILGGGTLTSFADMILIMCKQKVAPIAGSEKAPSQLEAWAVFCTVFLGYEVAHQAS